MSVRKRAIFHQTIGTLRTNGPMSTRPLIRTGASAAAHAAAPAPIEVPITVAGPASIRSSRATMSLPIAEEVWSGQPVEDWPWPRRSMAIAR